MPTRQAVTGRLYYSRWFTYHLSAMELFSFTVLYLGVFMLSRGWFFLGGALACAVLGVQHLRISRKQRKQLASG